MMSALSKEEFDRMLDLVNERKASDLHIRVGDKPFLRVNGILERVDRYPVVAAGHVTEIIDHVLTDQQKEEYGLSFDSDTSYQTPAGNRFRCAFLKAMGAPSVAFRLIPQHIPGLDEISAPRALLDMARQPRGLVLVTGPTGSGKTTTLAALIDLINEGSAKHILTIEDPLEFVHTPKRSLVTHREVGRDVPSFARGLRGAMRQDPDIIMVGELRDLETTETAMYAAETGHLVFATVHTSSAPSTVERIVSQFPEGEQERIRTQLSAALTGIICQTLIPRADGYGRVAAHEVMIGSQNVRAYIRDGSLEQLRSVIQTESKIGMQTMDQALAWYAAQGIVTVDVARSQAQSRNEFDKLIEKHSAGEPVVTPALITSEDMLTIRRHSEATQAQGHAMPAAAAPQPKRGPQSLADRLLDNADGGGWTMPDA
jgi:twitching motility protein PilT